MWQQVSWMMVVYAQNGFSKKVAYPRVMPNSTTFYNILLVCTIMEVHEGDMGIHQRVVENYFLSNIVLGVPIAMSAKCGGIHKVQKLFDNMSA